MKVFGPVPSRRLGRSIGINNVPVKNCSYECIYCQIGHTTNKHTNISEFYPPEDIKRYVEQKVEDLKAKGERIDYLSFVPDGDPTLDVNLGKIIDLIKPLGVKIAVITNSSQVYNKEIQANLRKADLVSLKVDAVSENIWRTINRPCKELCLTEIKNGILDFAKTFKGKLITETMLVDEINDDTKEIKNIANFILEINPYKSYISVPIRPPAIKWVRPISESAINKAYQIFSRKGIQVEYLIGYEGNSFFSTGNIEEDILSITAVHPMRKEAVEELLKKENKDWTVVKKLVDIGKLNEVEFESNNFFVRNYRK